MKLPHTQELESKWPKRIPNLTEKQIQIKNDWMKYWLEVLPNKYGIIEKFSRGFTVKVFSRNDVKIGGGGGVTETLEIGPGLGGHIAYENLDNQQYSVIELSENMASTLRERFPVVNVVVGDIQERTAFCNAQFDRVMAVHVLEHLPNLPCALKEIHRVMKDDGGFTAVIPCEGGLAYRFARAISAERLFKKKFKMEYDWLIKTDHVNQPGEIFEEIEKYFVIQKSEYFPLAIPFVFCNICIGLYMSKKA